MEIDVTKTAGEISPLWFGHNLEHTRSCLWQGLSGQLIRNRKFVGSSSPGGVARHWHRIGPQGCLFRLERAAGVHNSDGETYTRRFVTEGPLSASGRQSQRMQSFRRGERCGIGQPGIPLAKGRDYECRLALLSDRELSVEVGFSGRAASGRFTTGLTVAPGEWREHGFTFTSPVSDDDALLEISFEGPGALWVGAVALLPADHFLGLRRDVVELLKAISVPILRWPGGNFAGCYLWKDGLLPVDRRAPFSGAGILPHTDGYDDHEVGTDEFVALCRELAAEPWITINMSLEGPQEAAAWVEYCNGGAETEWGAQRAKRGHPTPYKVKYWSLGNEMGYGHMRGPNTPGEYGEMAARCAEAMKKADPSIVLVASGTWWEEEWFQITLAEFGGSFDHIAFHEYTPLMRDYSGAKGKEEFRRVAAAPSRTIEALREVRERADRHAPDGKFVGISFDEWNVWHSWFRVPGVAEGIYTAAMLNMFCREAREVGMTIGAYFEPVNEGAIRVGPHSARLTPAGQVFSLFEAHQGNQLLLTAPAEAEGDLDVAASLVEAGGAVIITLVNCSPDANREAEFLFVNAAKVRRAKGVLLSSESYGPESEFRETELQIERTGSHGLTVAMPAHSVARIQVVCR